MKSYSIHTTFGFIACIITGVAIILGFFIIGSPTNERARRIDEKRIQHLRDIHQEILNIAHDGSPWGEKKEELPASLPETLRDTADQARFRKLHVQDPVSGIPYGYEVLNDNDFKLCAVFDTERSQEYDIMWDHPVGEHCFEFDARNTDIR